MSTPFAATEHPRGTDGRFVTTPSPESTVDLGSGDQPAGRATPITRKGVRSNQAAYALDAPVTWTEPDWRRGPDEEGPARTRQFDTVLVSRSRIEAEVLVVGIDREHTGGTDFTYSLAEYHDDAADAHDDVILARLGYATS